MNILGALRAPRRTKPQLNYTWLASFLRCYLVAVV